VLDELEKILICISYESNIEINKVAIDPSLCKPVYEEMDGWMCSTKDFTEWSSLPKNARLYLDRIATVLQLPISMVSTGPERESIIFKH
jgi:adenylosuccinate synthase